MLRATCERLLVAIEQWRERRIRTQLKCACDEIRRTLALAVAARRRLERSLRSSHDTADWNELAQRHAAAREQHRHWRKMLRELEGQLNCAYFHVEPELDGETRVRELLQEFIGVEGESMETRMGRLAEPRLRTNP